MATKSKKSTKKPAAKPTAKAAHPAPLDGEFIVREALPKDEIKLPREGSKRHLVLSSMVKGVTIAELVKLTGWAESAARGFFGEDCRKCGVGVKRVTKNGASTYFVVLPKGMTI